MIYWIRRCSASGPAPEAPLTAEAVDMLHLSQSEVDAYTVTRLWY
jgi:hypothetical protein